MKNSEYTTTVINILRGKTLLKLFCEGTKNIYPFKQSINMFLSVKIYLVKPEKNELRGQTILIG